MKLFFDKDTNKYDFLIFTLAASLMAGEYGGSLQLVRVLGLIYLPVLFSTVRSIAGFYFNPVRNLSLFFIALSLISLLWSNNPYLGIKDIIYFIIHFLIFVEIVSFSYLARKPLKSLSVGWTIALLSTIIIAVWEIKTGQHLSTSKLDSSATLNYEGQALLRVFAAATFYNYNQYEVFICYCTPFLTYLVLTVNKKKVLPILYTLLGLSFYVVVTNASRSATVAVLVFYVLTIRGILMRRGSFKMVYILLTVGIVFLFYSDSDEMLNNLIRRIQTSGYDSSRFEIWDSYWHAIEEKYFLGLGAGGMSTNNSNLTNVIAAPHNMFLEILLYFGVLGFGYFLKKIISLFIKCIRVKDKIVRLILIGAFVAMPAYCITNSTYLFDATLYVYFGSIYVFMRSNFLNSKNTCQFRLNYNTK